MPRWNGGYVLDVVEKEGVCALDLLQSVRRCLYSPFKY